jgi:tRNA G18 (ribose-2'-O)-methylase SpoU
MFDDHPTPIAGKGPLVHIGSSDDPRLDLYRRLNDPAARTRLESDHSVFVVEGRIAVGRLLTSRYMTHSLLLDDHQLTAASGLVMGARARGATVFVASREVLADTVGFALHRGIVAVGNRPSPTDPARLLDHIAASRPLPSPPARVAVLEGLNDHENIGALFRNAAAFGLAGVFLDPTCADPLYRRSIRVSVGHALHMPFARFARWPGGLDQLRNAGFIIASLAPAPPTDVAVPVLSLSEFRSLRIHSGQNPGVALLLGAEGPGLTSSALGASDVVLRIPMAAGVDSINVATAAAVAFHALADC